VEQGGEAFDELRDALTKYIEDTYHIGHPVMVRQRRRLLEEPGAIFQFPYLESTPRYVSGERYGNMSGIPRAAREALTLLADKTLGKPLLFDPPYSHQAEVIQEVLGNNKNLMVMTGTGSGKTEAFLLPILGKLTIEARYHSTVDLYDYKTAKGFLAQAKRSESRSRFLPRNGAGCVTSAKRCFD
jgi:hypothetical protein